MTQHRTDPIADQREDRLRRLTQAETEARTYTGQLLCLLCGRDPNPDDPHAEMCRCAEPVLPSIDSLFEAVMAANTALTEQLAEARDLDAARVRELQQANTRVVAGQAAVDQMAAGLARFIFEARKALGVPVPVPPQTAALLADVIREGQ